MSKSQVQQNTSEKGERLKQEHRGWTEAVSHPSTHQMANIIWDEVRKLGGDTAEAYRLDVLEKIAIICASLRVIYALGKAFFFSNITCCLGFSVCGHSDRSLLGILAEKQE